MEKSAESGGKSPGVWLVLIAYAVSGAAALIYEVTWTRALALVLGNTVYALSTMLATFMAGLAIGSYIGGRLSLRFKNLLLVFALCELGIGITGLISIPTIYRLPSLYLYIYRHFHPFPSLFLVFEIFMCVTVMIVPTVLMGATFPIVCKMITRSVDDVGEKTGQAYSMNTVGAVVGSFVAGFLFIPFIGIKGTTFVAASANTGVALLMMLVSGKKSLIVLTLVAPAIMVSTGRIGLFKANPTLLNFYTVKHVPFTASYEDIENTERAFREVFYEEHPEGIVRAFKNRRDKSLVLQVDGKIEGTGAGDMPNTLLLAYLPAALHPNPERFLVIGLGAGVTLSAAKEVSPDVSLVEINPGVLKAVELHGPPLALVGTNVFINDARNQLFRNDDLYDIISSEPSIPTEFSTANLFSKEFFELASKRLRPGGILCQWFPNYLLKEGDLRMLYKTFGMVFPHAYAFRVSASNDVIVVGSTSPMEYDGGAIAERIRGLNRSKYKLDYALLMGPDDIRDIVMDESIPVNSDNRPMLEFRVARNMLTPSVKH